MARFEVDHQNKAFVITLGGFAATERASNFVNDLKQEVSKIHPIHLSLIVDSTELKTFKPEILPVLEKSYRKIAKKVKFTGIFVPTLAEALTQASQS